MDPSPHTPENGIFGHLYTIIHLQNAAEMKGPGFAPEASKAFSAI
jgi:hypothetical protein